MPNEIKNPSLLLLPGLMCDATFWQPLVDAVPSQVVDYGDANSITAMAEAALAVAPSHFALAGHSMGGRVALEVLRLAPERVQKIILMDTGYLPKAAGAAGIHQYDFLYPLRRQAQHFKCHQIGRASCRERVLMPV